MPILEQRRNPPPENRVIFKNIEDPSRARVPRQPTPNMVVLDDVCDDQSTKQEGYYLPDEFYETMQMDECEASMYIHGEGHDNPNSQENFTQKRGFVNRPKNKGDSNKEKEKENPSEKVMNEKVTIGTTRQPVATSSTQMTYNVMEDLIKLRISFSFIEVVKIPQQRQNILKFLDDP
jgi:hypothetical protein